VLPWVCVSVTGVTTTPDGGLSQELGKMMSSGIAAIRGKRITRRAYFFSRWITSANSFRYEIVRPGADNSTFDPKRVAQRICK